MTALSVLTEAPPPLRPIARGAMTSLLEPRLAWAGLVILVLIVPTTAALLVDERLLNSVSIWVKPVKFQVSVGVYLLTLAWFAAALPEQVRKGRLVGILIGGALTTATFEIGYITLQAARGIASHYNVGDTFHRTMYTLMGVGAVTLTAVSPAFGILLSRHRPEGWTTAFWLSAIMGLTLTFVLGAGAGAVLSAGDGHWIGGMRTDAGGVPVFGWSRTGGDLRAAHFFGMHALHVLPVLGFAAGRALPSRAAVTLVLLATAAYCGATAIVFNQALNGVPLVPAL